MNIVILIVQQAFSLKKDILNKSQMLKLKDKQNQVNQK